jgi:hypothetical protein
MALLGPNIDRRTLAGLAANVAANYTHGLPATPDTVDVRFVTNAASSSNFIGICAVVNVTGVTIHNAGAAASPNMDIVTMCLHTEIR